VGLTVVALGTSAPELVVSVQAAIAGKPDISIGNVVGSNIANIGLILGVTVLIFPMFIRRRTLTFDWLILMAASILFYIFALDGLISRFEGVLFFSGLIAFIVYSFYHGSREKNKVEPEIENNNPTKWIYLILYVLLGSVGLVIGAKWFLEGAETIARNFGVSDRVIAISLVAFGTSVPELSASIIAAVKKQQEISLGNIIGSNIFNILAVLGITSIIHPVNVLQEVVDNDLIWMLGITLILLPLGLMGLKYNRIDGVIFLGVYSVFIYLLLFGV
jgi:cation:H+ antiporter